VFSFLARKLDLAPGVRSEEPKPDKSTPVAPCKCRSEHGAGKAPVPARMRPSSHFTCGGVRLLFTAARYTLCKVSGVLSASAEVSAGVVASRPYSRCSTPHSGSAARKQPAAPAQSRLGVGGAVATSRGGNGHAAERDRPYRLSPCATTTSIVRRLPTRSACGRRRGDRTPASLTLRLHKPGATELTWRASASQHQTQGNCQCGKLDT
jgi:hypothetical protein